MAATIVGVLLSVAFGAFATAFAWLRSDMSSGFKRLDAKVDDLIMALAHRGQLTDPKSGTED